MPVAWLDDRARDVESVDRDSSTSRYGGGPVDYGISFRHINFRGELKARCEEHIQKNCQFGCHLEPQIGAKEENAGFQNELNGERSIPLAEAVTTLNIYLSANFHGKAVLLRAPWVRFIATPNPRPLLKSPGPSLPSQKKRARSEARLHIVRVGLEAYT